MSILIPGMEMPKDGECIIVSSDGTVSKYKIGDVVLFGGGAYNVTEDVIDLPPHGRLGDLDEMAVDESEAYMSAQLKLGDDVITKSINEAVHTKIVRLIADTPTIIPADPEGGADNG